jgi:hypothetical protein
VQSGGYLGQPPEGPGQSRDLFGGFQPQPQPGFGGGFGPAADGSQFDPATRVAIGSSAARTPRWWRRKPVLIGGAVAIVVIALVGVFLGVKLNSGPSDPGCKAYANTALGSYNNAVEVLNSQASQNKLGADLTTAVTDLTSAAGQAQSASARSALTALLAELKTVQRDVASGSVPSSVVTALNADSATADNVCS